MKKTIRGLLTIAMVLAMLLSLAGCGGSDNKDSEKDVSTEEARPEFAYVAKFTKLEDKQFENIYPISMDENGILYSIYQKVGEKIPEGAVKEFEGQFDVYETRLGVMDYSGKGSLLKDYEPLKPDEEDENDDYSSGISGFISDGQGGYITVENIYTTVYTGPEGVEKYSDEYWQNTLSTNSFYLRRLNADGAELSITEIELPEDSYINGSSMVTDGEGNLIMVDGQTITAISSEGKVVYTVEADDYVETVIKLDDGRIAVSYWGQMGPVTCELDTVNKRLGQELKMPRNAYNIKPGGDLYDFCYTDGLYLMGFNAGEEPEKVLNWMDLDINPTNMRNFYLKADGSVSGISENYSHRDGIVSHELFYMERVPSDTLPQKQQLTLALMWPDQRILDLAIAFNRSNDSIRINIKDYSEYNTEEDYDIGKTKLLTEMLAGDMPDIVGLSGLPYTQLAAKGLIDDLYPYIDGDKELSRDDFFQTVLESVEVDGKLCQSVSNFSINTVSGAVSVVGDTPGWTYKDFNEALSKMPEGCAPMGPYSTKDGMLRSCLYVDLDLYADWTTGKCSFDSPEFVELLEFANQFQSEFDWEHYEPDPNTDEVDLLSSGMQMLSSNGVYDIDSIMFNDAIFGGESTYIGYPSASGIGNSFSFNEGFAITKNCANKDAAWQFIRQLMTEDYALDGWGLPANRKAFDILLKEAMTPDYQKDENGNFVLDENGDKIEISHHGFGTGNHNFDIYAMTQAQADKLMELIDNTHKVSTYDSKLIEIASEEAQAYFSGQKTAQDVARLIQSKANIYINEQR